MENLSSTTSNQDELAKKLHLIESTLLEIQARNKKVELEKAWETSGYRLISITAITYLTMNLILWSIDGPFPPVHAIVPTAGYVLSTLSLSRIRQFWLKSK